MSDIFEMGDVVEDELSVIGTIVGINPAAHFPYSIQEVDTRIIALHRRTPHWRKVPMKNETNRLAQIIGHAADKYRGLAGLCPTEQDKAAALAIEAEYLFIRRDELPATSIIDRNGDPQLEVAGAEIGTWPLKHPKNTAEQQRKYALEYFAAHIAIQQWHDDALTRRRDELARQFANDKTSYNNGISPALQAAINQIIELEASRADVV